MLKWEQIVQHEGMLQRLCENSNYPVDVRLYLHAWIEDQPWTLLNPNNPADEPKAAQLLQNMLVRLHSKIQELSGDSLCLQRKRLEHYYNLFRREYRNNALRFLRFMRDCLEQESRLLRTMIEEENGMPMEATESINQEPMKTEPCTVLHCEGQMIEKLQELQAYKQRMMQLLCAIWNNQDLCKLWQQRQNFEEPLKMLSEFNVDAQLKAQAQSRMELAEVFNETLHLLQPMLNYVLDEMMTWKRNQQLACNGTPPSDDAVLDKLQYWFESMAEVLLLMYKQMKILSPEALTSSPLVVHDPWSDPTMVQLLQFLSNYREPVKQLLHSLLCRSLVVERQPDQVVQKKTYFSVTVRLLVSRALDLKSSAQMPIVEASILTEEEVRQWWRDASQVRGHNEGLKLTDNKVRLEPQKCGSSSSSSNSASLSPHSAHASEAAEKGPLTASFRMQYEVIATRQRRGQERVTQVKRCCLFRTTLNVEGIPVELQVLSLPVVLTVHCNQKCRAAATILWDNAFPVPFRESFEVLPSGPWSQLAQHMQTYCEKMTGRPLRSHHLQCLADKIFGFPGMLACSQEVTLSQFRETPLKDHRCLIREKKTKSKRSCTLWDWFYDAIRVIQKSLKGMWEDGCIEGFVSKAQAEDMLKSKTQGTFLFRFSDSECGALSIVLVETINGRSMVKHLEPLDPESVSIVEKIRGPNRLLTLYPDIPKDQALSRHYAPPEPTHSTRYTGIEYIDTPRNIKMGGTIPEPHSGSGGRPLFYTWKISWFRLHTNFKLSVKW